MNERGGRGKGVLASSSFRSPPEMRGERLLVPLQAYVDDSGNEPTRPVFVLAGFVSTIERWNAFIVDWQSVCGTFPSTPDFRMATANRLKGGYWGGPSVDVSVRQAHRDKRVAELIDVIKRHAVIRVQASMAWDTYRQHYKALEPAIRSPYYILFCSIVLKLASWLHSYGGLRKVEFTFDEQSRDQLLCLAAHNHMLKVIKPDAASIISSTPVFRSDSAVIPLKAADMLAWHIHRHVTDGETARVSGIERQMSPQIERLLEISGIVADVHKQHFSEMIRQMNISRPDRL